MEASADIDREDASDSSTPDYRSISSRAVLAFVLGLASPVALAAPLLLAVPAAAVGVAALALSQIRRAAGDLAGVGLARCGLALALASVAAATIRAPVRDALMRRQVAATASEWFDALAQGRIADAEALLSAQALAMFRPQAEPGQPPTPEDQVEAIVDQALRNDEVTRRLVRMKPPLTVRLASPDAGPAFDGSRTLLGADFDVSDGSEDPGCRIHLQLVRHDVYAAQGHPWRVERWTLAPPESASAPAGGPSP